MHLLFFHTPFLQALATALCWTLVHSLWQGLMTVIVAGLVMLLTRKSRPVVRYNLLTGLFVLFALAAALTFYHEWRSPGQVSGTGVAVSLSQPMRSGGQSPIPPPPTGSATGSRPATDAAQLLGLLTDLLSRNAVLIVAIWCFVLAIRIFRMSCTLLYTRHIKRHRSHRPPVEWVDRLASLCVRLHIRKPVTLLESSIIKLPAVFGCLKPVIFVPFGLLTQLPPSQVEAILIHELAHIRRNDFLMNLVQSIVENLFFFNPAATWLSSLIREAREHCCDDIALEQTHDKQQFIRALISCMTRMTSDQPNLTISFLGRRNAFVNRAERIVHNRNKVLNKAEGFFLGLSLIAVGLLTLAFMEGRRTEPGLANVAAHAARRSPLKMQLSKTEPLKEGLPEMDLQKKETKNEAPSKTRLVKAYQRLPINDTLPHAIRDTGWGPYHEMRINDPGDIVAEIVIHGVNYRLRRTNGVITELYLDHKEIPQAGIPNYSAITDAICADVEAHFNRFNDQKERFNDQMEVERSRDDLIRKINVDRAREDSVHRQQSKMDADVRQAKLAEIQEKINALEQERLELENSALDQVQQRSSDAAKMQEGLQQRQTDLLQRIDDDMKKEEKVKAIMVEMVSEHLVKDRESLKTFTLNNDELIINGVRQPAEVHERFKAKFLKSPGDRYNLVNN